MINLSEKNDNPVYDADYLLSNLCARGMLLMFYADNDLAIEVAKHPFRSAFGAVDRDDAEVFRSNRLNPLLDLARRLPDESCFRARKFPFPGFRNHPIVS